ncbi:MAG: type III restriction enzyme res subunit [Cenarchaeum symbiont of Oopsacas minuta]|nr:type III restriction enzyme res subunit [Cenarchaeum symbiont of Oopsacas minuta]
MNMVLNDFLKKKAWDSGSDDILENFYKPALLYTKRYRRLTGFFSSGVFLVALRESLDFIKNGGIIQMVTSTKFSPNDLNMMTDAITGKNEQNFNPSEILTKIAQNEFNDSTELLKNCAAILGYMLHNKVEGESQLQIKIAIPNESNSIFHQKIGILDLKSGDRVSFSGSVNETAKGWKENIEEFKVFHSSNSITHEWFEHDCKTFDRYWNNNAPKTTVIDLPEAINHHLIKKRVETKEEFEIVVESIRKILDEIDDGADGLNTLFSLYPEQNNAIDLWAKNNYQGILEMATGTGKTLTSIGCIHRLLQEQNRMAIIVACPYTHLIEQWDSSLHKWNKTLPNKEIPVSLKINAYGDSGSDWKNDLDIACDKFNRKSLSERKYTHNRMMIYTTHQTASDSEFLARIKKLNGSVLLIVDEVHNIGAPKFSNALVENYEYRLGLSATPTRHFDVLGSQIILKYFTKVVFSFSIGDAISKKRLSEYDYIPHYVDLNDDEKLEYQELTKKIARSYYSKKKLDDAAEEEYGSRFEIERSKKITKASNKYDALERILETENIKYALIYCHDQEQMHKVNTMLVSRNIKSSKITWEDPTEDRLQKISLLTTERYDCITAVRCLDEGVDIPYASLAIIMASSGNPRQYIQRRGRVLRKNPDGVAVKSRIHDILVKTITDVDGSKILPFERKLVAKELLRHKEFAQNAANKDEAIAKISKVAKEYGIDLELLSEDYILNNLTKPR